ncbi:MAG: DNA repair protein RecO [Nitrospinota bacterium]
MPVFRDEAITLRHINFAEADRIVSFFSKKRGILKAIAKGARKLKSRFAGRLEPFHHVEIVYFGKENTTLFNLNSVEFGNARKNIASDLGKYNRACYLTEMIASGLREGDANPSAFEAANAAFELLDGETSPLALDWIVRFFDLKFLASIGYRPTLDVCVSCRKPILQNGGDTEAAFDVNKGGLVCPACRPKSKSALVMSAGSAKFMGRIANTAFDKAKRLKPSARMMEEISRSIIAFRNSRLHATIKSERFFA